MLKKIVFVSVLVLGLALYFRSGKWLGVIVKVNEGSVQGVVSKSRDGREYLAWHHIPYAKPPVGNLRFTDPEPAESWEGVRDGLRFGPLCAQTGLYMMGTSGLVGDKDCLHLNVFVPNKVYEESQNSGKKFPVLFYIHGGGYQWGSSDAMAADYVADEDIVFVSINYRLAMLGFLTTGDKVVRGNMGLKDQTMALKWVSKNIHFFGGDPAKVTIMGPLGGAAGVHQQMQSPLSKGLFNKAVSQSGVASVSWGMMKIERALEKTRDIAGKLKCLTSDKQEMIDCLRAVQLKELLEPFMESAVNHFIFKPTSPEHGFVPIVEAVQDEKAFLTEHPSKLMAEGKSHRVPWMVGYCTSEGLMTSVHFIADPNRMSTFESNPEEHIERLFAIRGKNKREISKQIWDYYFPPSQRATLSTQAKLIRYTEMFGDGSFFLDIHEAVRYQRKYSPVYYYMHNRTEGPNNYVDVMINVEGKYHFGIEIGMYLVKALYKTIFGVESYDYGISHAMDVIYYGTTMGMSLAHKWSSHYEYSKDLVRLLVDFMRDDSKMKFMGVSFKATPTTGPLKLFEFKSNNSEMRSEPYQDRMNFLRSLVLRNPSKN